MEYEIKIPFYKDSKTPFGWGIRQKQKYINRLWKYSKYSHTEIIYCYIDDKDVLDKMAEIENIYWCKRIWDRIDDNSTMEDYLKEYNLWFSSSEKDGKTRFKFIEDNKNNWDFITIKVTKEQYLKALDFCISQDWKSYDYLAIVFAQLFKTFWFYRKDSW